MSISLALLEVEKMRTKKQSMQIAPIFMIIWGAGEVCLEAPVCNPIRFEQQVTCSKGPEGMPAAATQGFEYQQFRCAASAIAAP